VPSSTPSLTWWTRLEPRPRSNAMTAGLAAAVRDPLWLLARQHQFGALRGEDAASAAYTRLQASVTTLVGWRPQDQTAGIALDGDVPLEAALQAEPVTPDLATRVELGQTFEALLGQALGGSVPTALRVAFRQAYPFVPAPEVVPVRQLFSVPWDFAADEVVTAGAPSAELRAAFTDHKLELATTATAVERQPGAQWTVDDTDAGHVFLAVRDGDDLELHLAATPDLAATRLLAVCAANALDGAALLQDLLDGTTPPPLTDPAFTTFQTGIQTALGDLQTWATGMFGVAGLGTGDPPGWRPDRLEYALELLGTSADGQIAVLASGDGQARDLDWHAFDLTGVQASVPGVQASAIQTLSSSVLPANVRFHGMPNARFWDFESAVTAYGDVRPDKRDLAKLIVMDFMLVHSGDWFVIPLQLPVGSLCTINQLLVHDVFGGITLVERADIPRPSGAPGSRAWTMFSTSDARPVSPPAGTTGPPVAGFLFLPPSSAASAQAGPAIEEVRLLHDEMANLAWAVERLTENAVGQPWPGQERSQAINAARTEGPAPSAPAPTGQGLRYRTQTPVPDNWIPLVPVTVDPARGDVALERGTIFGEWGQQVEPKGRLLATLDQLREEELPKQGLRAIRRAHRSRWTDGSTHLWFSRARLPGEGEGASGLRFDQAVAAEQVD
jgi:hypothetical protein